MRQNWRGWLIVLCAGGFAVVVGVMLLCSLSSKRVYPVAERGQGISGVLQEEANEETGSSQRICINTASVSQLQRLPGIGRVQAEKIVRYRETIGHFLSIEQLADVDGIGEKTLETIQTMICLEGEQQ